MTDDSTGNIRPDELHQDELRQKIDALVARLPASLVYSLLSEIEGMDSEPTDRVQLVRQYVIEYLNRQRTNRARRLFTNLFEAFLIDDDVLYHAGLSIPGMLQRVDVGALWEALSRDAFPLLAVEAQETLDEMARGDVIDRILRSPVAMVMKERMRVAAVKHLDAVLANRKSVDELLAALSRNRPRRTRLMSGFLEKTPAIDIGTLRLMHLVLANAEGAVKPVAERLEPALDREHASLDDLLCHGESFPQAASSWGWPKKGTICPLKVFSAAPMAWCMSRYLYEPRRPPRMKLGSRSASAL